MKAIWSGQIIAESDATIIVEGNHYFPPDAIKREYFESSSTRTYCGWKGECSYYTLAVGEKKNPDAAWYYPEPMEAAKKIAGYVAFWKGVQVIPGNEDYSLKAEKTADCSPSRLLKNSD